MAVTDRWLKKTSIVAASSLQEGPRFFQDALDRGPAISCSPHPVNPSPSSIAVLNPDLVFHVGLGAAMIAGLTANPDVLRSATVKQIAKRLVRTPAQVVFRFALQIGMLPLTGTTDPIHMREDLDVLGFAVDDADVGAIEEH